MWKVSDFLTSACSIRYVISRQLAIRRSGLLLHPGSPCAAQNSCVDIWGHCDLLRVWGEWRFSNITSPPDASSTVGIKGGRFKVCAVLGKRWVVKPGHACDARCRVQLPETYGHPTAELIRQIPAKDRLYCENDSKGLTKQGQHVYTRFHPCFEFFFFSRFETVAEKRSCEVVEVDYKAWWEISGEPAEMLQSQTFSNSMKWEQIC